MIATCQTRIAAYAGLGRAAGDAALDAYGELYGRVQRRLFADMAAGHSAPSLKSTYLKRYGISARMFNALRASLEGKINSVRKSRNVRLDDLLRRIARARKQTARAEKHGRLDQAHRKRRGMAALERRLLVLQAEVKAGLVRLCFGSKALWRKQYHLGDNGYAGHDDWLQDWRSARTGEFFVLGSRDETAGCQLCAAGIADDGSLTLRLRMPDSLAGEHGKHVTIEGVRFAYGHEHVLAALDRAAEYAACRRERGEKAARGDSLGQAVSYRFKRDARGWRIFVTTQTVDVPVVTDQKRGAIGVDLNADHLAVAETDASGNYLHAFRVPLVACGKSRDQAEAVIGDAVARVVDYAGRVGKPIVLEQPDFPRKKAALEGESRRYGRMLSSFGYGKTQAYFLSRGHRRGVEVRQVNPALSSVIGWVKFMERYGLSAHQAAALVLARRLLGCSERVPRRWVAPSGNGAHVAFRVPARKRAKHVWAYWAAISRQLRPALAAHHRLGKSREGPNPTQAFVRARADSLDGIRSVIPGAAPGRSRLAQLGRRRG